MHVIFDLDGTLADTRGHVVRAYDIVGVDMPDGAWGRPASEWLPQIIGEGWHEVHRQKNVALRALHAKYPVAPLAASHLLRTLFSDPYGEYEPGILTGASFVSARATMRALGFESVRLLGVSCSLEDKIRILTGTGRGIYLDDDHDACLSVTEQTDWRVIYVSESTGLENLLTAFSKTEELCTE